MTSLLLLQLQDWEEDFMLAIYADDSAYLVSSRRADLAVAKLQRVLDLLPDWLYRWRFAIHEGGRPYDRSTAYHATEAETPGTGSGMANQGAILWRTD
ncbi:hypothetical protein EVAR_93683_1 [Eumeta japonica]|uniref:Reverse transcriptase domain-containing protein n=1 Tax=Eumeta variegata TaxID=151549 RepID=A0A4C1TQQ1_EUMVA|nr:hypothetical protein EVAR_93683_1 [Eumeta japonica]